MQFEFIENTKQYSINFIKEDLSYLNSKEVNRLWNKAKKENPNLFSDNIFYIDHIDKIYIDGFFSEYKYWYIQNKFNQTYSDKKLMVAGVTGVIRESDQLLALKRTNMVHQDKNMYELGPAGGLSILNNGCKDQLINEFEEELDVSSKNINSIKQLGILIDKKEFILDIVFEINVRPNFDKKICFNHEYGDFKWISLFEKKCINDLSPSSKEIFNYLQNKELK